jgi:DNA-directed RNA polymerase specialized sigma24 family protein
MYASFCLRLKRGEFELEGRGDLMKLLVTMTLYKTRRAVARHRRQRRDTRRETAPPPDLDRSTAWAFEQMDRAAPTPEEAVTFAEGIERQLSALDAPLRQIVLWKLEGYTNAEIAAPDKLNCAERTIERKLQRIRELWLRECTAG